MGICYGLVPSLGFAGSARLHPYFKEDALGAAQAHAGAEGQRGGGGGAVLVVGTVADQLDLGVGGVQDAALAVIPDDAIINTIYYSQVSLQ